MCDSGDRFLDTEMNGAIIRLVGQRLVSAEFNEKLRDLLKQFAERQQCFDSSQAPNYHH